VVQPETGKNAIKNPHPVDCWVRVIAPNRVEGSGNFVGGWNQSPYTIHFSASLIDHSLPRAPGAMTALKREELLLPMKARSARTLRSIPLPINTFE
jgi:hypothetical protein